MTVQPIKNDQGVATLTNPQSGNSANLTTPTSQLPTKNKLPLASDSLSISSTADSLTIGLASAGVQDGSAASRLASFKDDAVDRLTRAKAVSVASAVDGQMENMKQEISQIIKSYPPFLMGSEKRVEYLMSIASIRHQIEAMTIPAVSAKTEKQGEIGKIWGDLFSGINIPTLTPSGPDEATDAQLQAAALTITTMQSTLVARSSGLQAEALLPTFASAPDALKASKTAGEGIAATGLPLSTQLGEILKNF